VVQEDAELVAEAQKGNQGAFEELVRRTSRLVFARLYLETGDPHRAEDLVQETYLTAFRSIQQVKDPKGFRNWLFSIAQTVAIDSFRYDSRKKRGAPRTDPEVLERLEGKSPEPSHAAEQKEARDQVLSILRSLPEEYRMPLMLRYLAGADYDTIGRQLGLSNGSLRGLLNRGMAMLRSELAKAAQAGRMK
jgi:RNA polymerase sigma-70 factor (ECF subfamily)